MEKLNSPGKKWKAHNCEKNSRPEWLCQRDPPIIEGRTNSKILKIIAKIKGSTLNSSRDKILTTNQKATTSTEIQARHGKICGRGDVYIAVATFVFVFKHAAYGD